MTAKRGSTWLYNGQGYFRKNDKGEYETNPDYVSKMVKNEDLPKYGIEDK